MKKSGRQLKVPAMIDSREKYDRAIRKVVSFHNVLQKVWTSIPRILQITLKIGTISNTC